MSDRYPQVKRLRSPEAVRARAAELGVTIPIDDEVDPAGPLSTPITFTDGAVGTVTIPNRFVALPMEGWDGTDDGRPTDLVRRRWGRLGASGCGLLWGEATAVRPDGRANPNQLVLTPNTVDGLAELRALADPSQVVGLQLTHSGRWSRPAGRPEPLTAYEHPVLDGRVDAGPDAVLDDEALDALAQAYVDAAVLAADAGFDFVDIKHCHGYLLHELLTARERTGRYGGSLAARTTFLRTVVDGIRSAVPTLAVAVRLSAFDLAPFVAGADGRGEPVVGAGAPRGFGADESGLDIDLSETHQFLDVCTELGIGLVSVTAGSPYYNPHIQRPAYFPPSDGYQPPEDPLVGVARQLRVTAALAERHRAITFVGSGYSYLQQWVAHVGQAVVGAGGAGLVGLGRMMLSYPHLAADVVQGTPLTSALVCRTFSDCTTAPRHGLVSGCFPLDPFYKDHEQRVTLAAVKRDLRRS